MRIEYDSFSERGLNPKRPMNEDRVGVFAEKGVFLVCDGVGGQNAGEIASQTVIDVAHELLSRPQPLGSPQQLAAAIIHEANTRVLREARQSVEHSGMATTVAMVIIKGAIATIAHLGDSRVYLLRDGKLGRVTTDHSYAEEAARAAGLLPAQIPRMFQNVISRAIGSEETVEPEVSQHALKPRDRILLCSDGVTRHVPDDEIQGILTESAGAASACVTLKDLCYSRGAEDNLSAVVLRIVDGGDEDEDNATRTRSRTNDASVSRPTSRIEVPTRTRSVKTTSPLIQPVPASSGGRREQRRHTRWTKTSLLVLLILTLVGGGFYAGTWYKRRARSIVRTGPVPSTECEKELTRARLLSTPGGKSFADGLAAFCAQRYREAIESFAVATQREPESGEMHYWRGRAEQEAGENQAALASLLKSKLQGCRREDLESRIARLRLGNP